MGRNPRTSIALARWSGLLVGGILARGRWASGVEWIKPDRWRSVAFALPLAIRRAEAKQRVRDAVRDRYPSVSRLASPALSEHVADAIGVALYGVGTQHQQENNDAEDGNE